MKKVLITRKPIAAEPQTWKVNLSLEDLTRKSAAQYFGSVLLPWLGIQKKLTLVLPTVQVVLTERHVYEDFNYATETENDLIHLEFESDSVEVDELRRFREYEATTSRTYQVSVTTYVICSSDVKVIKSELNESFNSYRVKIIQLKDMDADLVFDGLMKKKAKGEKLEREDLVPVLLTPLMSGKLSQKERVISGIKLLQGETIGVDSDELEKMQAVIYTLANKFLNQLDLNDVREIMVKTRLGQILMEDGMSIGLKGGIAEAKSRGSRRW